MSESTIPRKEVWKLIRQAGSLCSFYGCKEEIVREEKGGILGNIAHIVAEKDRGTRGHSALTLEERNCYPNLILLCPNHHSLIDNIDNEAEWTVEKPHKFSQTCSRSKFGYALQIIRF